MKVFVQIIQSNKGYYLLASIMAIALILLIFLPKNAFSWGFFLFIFVRVIRMKHQPFYLLAIMIILFTLCVTLLHTLTNHSKLSADSYVGEIYLNPSSYRVNGDYLSGEGELKGEKVTFYHRIETVEEQAYWQNSIEPILMTAHLSLVKPEKARNRYQFDYQKYLYQKRIFWTVEIKDITEINKAISIKAYISKIRLTVIHFFHSKLQKGQTHDYVMAMIFNQADYVDVQNMEAYRKIGVIHLFSISGMHVYFLIQTFQYLLLRMGMTRERTKPILLITILFYGFISGGSVGIHRAVLTNSLLLIADIFKVDLEAQDAFACVLLISLWLNPYIIFSLAFQLSYTLSGLLYVLSARLELLKMSTFRKSIFLSFIMTCTAGIYLSYHYFEISWLGVWVNVLFSILFTTVLLPIFWGLCVLILLPFFQHITVPIFLFTNKLLLVTENISHYLAKKNGLTVITGRPPFIFYILVLIVLIHFLVAIEEGKNIRRMVLLTIFTYLCFGFLPYLNPSGRVIILDVGQGDAILIKTPFQKQTILIDTGGYVSFNQEKKSWQIKNSLDHHGKELVSAIKAEGIKKLDAVFLTHADTDHVGNVSYLANELRVQTIYLPSGMEEDEGFMTIYHNIQKKPTLIPLIAPQVVSLADLHFKILSPDKKGRADNNSSLVLLTKIAGLNWLLTGDLEESGEFDLIRRYPQLRIDVLKVGHHGSKSSSSEQFLNHIKPKVALISAGLDNRYGHPHSEVVERLSRKNVKIYRTDKQGAIHFIYFSQKKTIQTMLQ